jgi:iron-sulfur cluster repair protein YtfE (RIC family)
MTNPPHPDPLDLDTRTGWPGDLAYLRARYPRETWGAHANLGEMAQFWLERHAVFRQLSGALGAAVGELRAGTAAPPVFQRWFAPRLQFFLSQLEMHHQVEDQHYFPILRAAEPRLARGFAVLDADHRLIHADIAASVAAANAFLLHLADADRLRRAGDDYAQTSERLMRRLARHLDDEEDLVIPLVLDRGEARLGAG